MYKPTIQEIEDLKAGKIKNARNWDLYDANLNGANLRYADLRGADLHNADLRGADLHNTIGNGKEIKSLQIEKYSNEFILTLFICFISAIWPFYLSYFLLNIAHRSISYLIKNSVKYKVKQYIKQYKNKISL
jgi:hypothetical protein